MLKLDQLEIFIRNQLFECLDLACEALVPRLLGELILAYVFLEGKQVFQQTFV